MMSNVERAQTSQLIAASAFFTFILTMLFWLFFQFLSSFQYHTLKDISTYTYILFLTGYLLYVNIHFRKYELTSLQSFFTGLVCALIPIVFQFLTNVFYNVIYERRGEPSDVLSLLFMFVAVPLLGGVLSVIIYYFPKVFMQIYRFLKH